MKITLETTRPVSTRPDTIVVTIGKKSWALGITFGADPEIERKRVEEMIEAAFEHGWNRGGA